MFKFIQSTGEILDDGKSLGFGYSGAPGYVNKPEHERLRNLGCIPKGKYTIGEAFSSPAKGPVSMRLHPYPENNMYNRAGFMIHGDSVKNPGTASQGCIILSRNIREFLANSDCKELEVRG